MRVLSLAIVAVPLCLALGVVRAHTQTAPSSQDKPSSQSTTRPRFATGANMADRVPARKRRCMRANHARLRRHCDIAGTGQF